MSLATATQQRTDSNVDIAASWNRVVEQLRFKHGEAVFKSWLKNLTIDHMHHGEIILAVPTRFIREWVMSHYADDITHLLKQEFPETHSVIIRVKTPTDVDESHRSPPNASREAISARVESQPTSLDQMSAQLDPRFTFDNFIIGKPNELAHAAALSIADADKVQPGSNPLFLYGGVGLGKTHLMHAIAWHIRKHHPQRKVIYLSAEKFMYQFISALRQKDIMNFKEQFRSVDVLMVDDVQFISGKDSTQEEFFHTFNALIDNHKQLVISGDRSPTDLEGIEERVRSRLGWGLVADINATTYELRLGILQAKSEHMDIHVPKDVIEFLAHKITSNVRELEGALNKVVAHSRLIGREITIENTQDILFDLLRAKMRIVTIEDIKKKVADHCNIRVSDMHSARRARSVARPRQIAMYLSKKLTSHSLPEIGRQFGGKDHTTVMHAVKKVEQLIGDDAEIADDVHLLMRMLQG